MSLSLKSIKGEAKAEAKTEAKVTVEKKEEAKVEPPKKKIRLLMTGSKGLLASWIKPAIMAADVDIINYDIRDGQDIFDEALLAEKMAGVDVCLHMAAYPHRGAAPDWPTFKTLNVGGAKAVYKAANKAGVNKFIYVSSGNVYCFGDKLGSQDALSPPVKVDNVPELEECHPYPRSKLTMEKWLRGQANTTKMQIVIMRPNHLAPTPPEIMKIWHGATITRKRMADYFTAAIIKKLPEKYMIYDIIEPTKNYPNSILAQIHFDVGY
jgi:nucleoside-diphosphate-sugar epimerase